MDISKEDRKACRSTLNANAQTRTRFSASIAAFTLVASIDVADFSLEALNKRLAILLPDIEKELGAKSSSPILIQSCTQEEMAKVIGAENAAFDAKRRAEEPDADEIEAYSVQARSVAKLILGKLDTKRGMLLVCPETFSSLAEAGEEFKGMLNQEYLDIILIHETIHVFQHRRFPLDQFIGDSQDIEEMIARSSVIEGHTEYIVERVARKRGLLDAFRLDEKISAQFPTFSFAGGRREFEENLAESLVSFPYLHGRKFFEKLVERFGYEKALETVFKHPPKKTFAIVYPEKYHPLTQPGNSTAPESTNEPSPDKTQAR